jgi:hypothetical protein
MNRRRLGNLAGTAGRKPDHRVVRRRIQMGQHARRAQRVLLVLHHQFQGHIGPGQRRRACGPLRAQALWCPHPAAGCSQEIGDPRCLPAGGLDRGGYLLVQQPSRPAGHACERTGRDRTRQDRAHEPEHPDSNPRRRDPSFAV